MVSEWHMFDLLSEGKRNTIKYGLYLHAIRVWKNSACVRSGGKKHVEYCHGRGG